jgi:hypothetical protein
MAILNYTTKVDYHKTLGEISKCLVAHGAKSIMVDYEDGGTPVKLNFSIEVNGKMVGFQLPARYLGVLAAFEKQKVPKTYHNKEQAVRTAWRIIKDWVEAQMAIVESELAEISEVFLPYALTQNGETLYDQIKKKGFGNLLENK